MYEQYKKQMVSDVIRYGQMGFKFIESEHPRDDDGKFSKAGNSGIDKVSADDNNNAGASGVNSESSNRGEKMAEYVMPDWKEKIIRKSGSMKNVDAYRSTEPQKIDGEWVVITGYGRSEDDHGGYDHSLRVRPCTPEEQKIGRIAELKKEISLANREADDARDEPRLAKQREELDGELRRLEGRPSAAEEKAAKAKEAAEKLPKLLAEAHANLDIPRDKKQLDDDGDEEDARDWWIINNAIFEKHGPDSIPGGNSIGSLKKLSDDQIRKLLG